MGQHSSKLHEPLTFGYINRSSSEDSQEADVSPQPSPASDFVLANPHLYRFEITCQNHCHKQQGQSASNSEGTYDEYGSSLPASVVVATEIGQECPQCRQAKRLSLVRRDLAEDLAYIDETYYPDIAHYVAGDMIAKTELLQAEDEDLDVDDDKKWSRLTIGEVSASKSKARLANPPLAVDLSGRSLIRLSPSIGYLDNLSKLDLSRNQMTRLPRTIGYLKNLTVFYASHNQLEYIPDTISYLSKLTTLNLSHNNLTHLPSSIGSLSKLAVLIVNDNKLTAIPRELKNLTGLLSLNVSNNPLRSLPAELGSLTSLRKLIADGCDFVQEFSHKLEHQPPSLFELCARKAVRLNVAIPSFMSEHIKEYFSRVQTCSFCGGPYFESFVTRGRFIERVSRQQIALEYTLCTAHWSDEDDRILALFSEQPETSRCTPKLESVNTDGLEGSSSSLGILSRTRAHSDTSNRSMSNLNLHSLSPSTSSQLSQRSTSNLLLAAHSGSSNNLNDGYNIPTMIRQPSLPALPTLYPSPSGSTTTRSASPLTPRPQRQRSSSSASVTKKITGFLSSPSLSFTRTRSSSGLSQQQWSASDVPLTEADNNMDHIEEQTNETEHNAPGTPDLDQITRCDSVNIGNGLGGSTALENNLGGIPGRTNSAFLNVSVGSSDRSMKNSSGCNIASNQTYYEARVLSRGKENTL